MTVGFLVKIFLLLIIPIYHCETNPFRNCNVDLLRSFKLTGMKHPSTQKLSICPNIIHNCCTMIDELAVSTYWKDFTLPKITKFANILAGVYQRMFNFQRYISKIDFDNIMVHFTNRTWFEYQQTICSRIEEVKEGMNFNLVKEFEIWEKQKKKKVNDLGELYVERNFISRKLKMENLTENQIKALKNVGFLKDRFKSAFENAFLRIKNDVNKQEKEVKKMATTIARSFRKESLEKYPNELEEFLSKTSTSKKPISKQTEEEQNEFVRKARNLLNETPTKLAEKALKFKSFISMVKKNIKNSKDALIESLKISGSFKLPNSNRKLKEIMRRILKKKKLPSITTFYVSEFQRKMDLNVPILQHKMQCEVHPRKAFRTFLQINRPKYEHCYKVYENMKILNTIEFDHMIVGIRENIVRVLDVKKTLYCSVCDADAHKYFNFEKEVLMLNDGFCRDLIGTYRELIEFSNIVMVQFGEQILQYIRCINSMPSEISLPFFTRLEFHKRNIYFFRKCLDNLLSDDYMRYCHFICSTFSFDKFSKYIDGDLTLMYSVYLEIIDFTRNNNIPFDSTLVVDDEFLRTLNHGFYPVPQPTGDPKNLTKIEVSNLDDAVSNTRYPSPDNFKVDGSEYKLQLPDKFSRILKNNARASDTEVFQRIKKVFDLKNAHYLFFSNDIGLSPMDLMASSDIVIEPDNFIRNHYKNLNKGKDLSSSTFKMFFTNGEKQIGAFKTDIDMQFDDSLVHKPPEIVMMSMAELLRTKREQQKETILVQHLEREEPESHEIF